MRRNIDELTIDGIDMWSWFTGKCTGPSTFVRIRDLLVPYGFSNSSSSAIRIIAGCDNDSWCQAIMKEFVDQRTGTVGLMHCFPGMESLLSNLGFRMAEALTPDPSLPAEQKAEMYPCFEDYLETHSVEAFGDGLGQVCGPCISHGGRLCKVFQPDAPVPNAEFRLSDSPELIDSSQGSAETSSVDDGAVVVAGNAPGATVAFHSRHKGWDIGSQCIDYSMRGKQQRHTGPSTKPFLIFVALVLKELPDFGFHEITLVGTQTLIVGNQKLIAAGYGFFQLALTSVKFGIPMKRPRRVTLFYKLLRYNFTGSEQDIWHHFLAQMVISADCYFITDDARANENFERARLQRNFYAEPAHCRDLDLEQMFTRPIVSIIENHLALRSTHEGLGGEFMCDAEQAPSYSAPGRHFRNTLSA